MKGPYGTGRFANVGDIGRVSSPDEAAEIVQRMLHDLLAHPDEWENSTLDRFLEALAASLESIPQPQTPTWKVFAEVLIKASGYE